MQDTAQVKLLEALRSKKGFICDMDGVIYHGNRLLPGVREFVDWLYKENKRFLFLTNSSERSPKELQQKLSGSRLQRLCYRRSRTGQRSLRCRHHHGRCQSRLCRCRRNKHL